MGQKTTLKKVPRRTQLERSSTMRKRLIDATIDCLLEHGYAATSTTLITRRARVSRGAQQHHFPSKSELVSAVLTEVFDRRVATFKQAMAKQEAGQGNVEEAIDAMWDASSAERLFAVWLELVVASRTDPELRAVVTDKTLAARAVIAEWSEFVGSDHPLGHLAPAFASVMMDGLALQNLSAADAPRTREMLAALKVVAKMITT